TEGSGAPLQAVGPRAARVGAVGVGSARLGRRLVAGAGAKAGAAAVGRTRPRAVRVARTPRCHWVPFEAAAAGGVDVAAEAAEDVDLAARGIVHGRLGHRARGGEGP